MTYSLPFIYLPDAVTLILLLVAFQMLRKIAVDHIRQELSLIREKLLLYWLLHELDLKEAGYIALRNIMGMPPWKWRPCSLLRDSHSSADFREKKQEKELCRCLSILPARLDS